MPEYLVDNISFAVMHDPVMVRRRSSRPSFPPSHLLSHARAAFPSSFLRPHKTPHNTLPLSITAERAVYTLPLTSPTQHPDQDRPLLRTIDHHRTSAPLQHRSDNARAHARRRPTTEPRPQTGVRSVSGDKRLGGGLVNKGGGGGGGGNSSFSFSFSFFPLVWDFPSRSVIITIECKLRSPSSI